jgi:hypothetical protein
VAADAGADEDERRHELRPRHGDLERNSAAERGADEGGRSELELVEQVDQVPRM